MEDAQPPLASGRMGACRALTFASALCIVALLPVLAHAETGYDAWLRYKPLDAKIVRENYSAFPAVVVALGDEPCIQSARDELIRGASKLLGRTLRSELELPAESAILLGTAEQVKNVVPTLGKVPKLSADGYWLKSLELNGNTYLLIIAQDERGVLYGTFDLLKKLSVAQPTMVLNERRAPANGVRMLNHWDRLDGSVSQGRAGTSVFWTDNHLTKDVVRIRDYARLLASVGINAISVNDPNAGHRLLSSDYRQDLVKLNGLLRPWGVRLFVALKSASPPPTEGGALPRDRLSSAMWQKRLNGIYKEVPMLGGFIVDVDWDRTVNLNVDSDARAESINALAEALDAHDGVLICRTCSCTASADSELEVGDPAKVAFEVFQSLDGKLRPNVIVQIPCGPTGTQVREAVSPLFAAMQTTNQAIEFDLTQEHCGQQRHLCFLVPAWKQALEFNMQADEGATPIKEIIAGKSFKRPLGAFVAVSNARRLDNWLGHDLAMANLYGFGRLAWNPDESSKLLVEEWTRLTFSDDPQVVGVVSEMLLKSWRAYENYTCALGMSVPSIAGQPRYGPGVVGAAPGIERTWQNADRTGIGIDRTVTSGSAFVGQYSPGLRDRFESTATCPDELVLYFHHVPYTHSLKSGKTVVQHIYDSHYQGARDASRFVTQWKSLRGRIDEERYSSLLNDLQYQAGHAELWRDAVCNWLLQTSGIADSENRIGQYEHRFEAEAMELDGFSATTSWPWEVSSGGQFVECTDVSGKASATMRFDREPGWYSLRIRYFDENDGASRFRLLVGSQLIDEWTADDDLPDSRPNGHTSVRRDIQRIPLREGDEIRVEATSAGGERAAVDFIEFEPASL